MEGKSIISTASVYGMKYILLKNKRRNEEFGFISFYF